MNERVVADGTRSIVGEGEGSRLESESLRSHQVIDVELQSISSQRATKFDEIVTSPAVRDHWLRHKIHWRECGECLLPVVKSEE